MSAGNLCNHLEGEHGFPEVTDLVVFRGSVAYRSDYRQELDTKKKNRLKDHDKENVRRQGG